VSALVTRQLGFRDLPSVWAEMKRFTESRDAATADELWFVEHPPVFTLGLNADRRHLLNAGDIPVVPIDRGGQVTYHGPGQLVAYVMLDIARAGLGIRPLVELLEEAVVATVAGYGIEAHGRRDAPGVYVADSKLAAIGLRVRRGCSYHGVAVNVAMDLEPFSRINPCGMEGLRVTQLQDLCGPIDLATFQRDFERTLRAGAGRYLPSAES
jgi:lipoyl(octanoyl) transferase